MDMRRLINMCPLVSKIFMLMQIKFDIDINDNKL
jgi:hypothetical protein